MQETQTPPAEAVQRQTAVVAARCTDYEFAAVQAALRQALAPLGGMASFVRPGERIALKPNLLFGSGSGAGHHDPSRRRGGGCGRGPRGRGPPGGGGEPGLRQSCT